MGKALEQRSSYRVLGVLLFLQLALSAGASAATLLMRSLARSSEQGLLAASSSSSSSSPHDSSGAAQHSRQGRPQRIVVLDVSDHLPGSRCRTVVSGVARSFWL